MVVCKFFLQGNCRFGANCRNEHLSGQGGNNGGGGGGGFGSQNRFGALSNTGSNNRFGGTSDNSKQYTLNPADIRLDLTRGQGRPQWVLSTYGAGRGTPASLFEGNEYSPEELRARFYEMASKGQEIQADQEAIQLWTKAEQDLDNAASHVEDITKFMEEADKKHPNRYDFLQTDGSKTRDELVKEAEAANTTSSGFGTTSAFGQSTTNSNPFAKPAAATFGQATAPSAFGGSSFGKPAQASAFGQPAFGQSGFGSSSSSSSGAFGQTSTPFGQSSSTGAFGQPAQPSAFGKPAFGASAFGQSAFGQTAQPSTASAFCQPAQPSNQSPFGQTSSAPAFGASGFGQVAKTNPFAAPSASTGFGASTAGFGQTASPASAFGQPSQPNTAFGQSPQSSQSSSGFGQTSQPGSGFGQSAFGKPAQPAAFGQSAFGQPAQPANSSPFGRAASGSGFGTNSSGPSAFGQTPQQNASPFAKANDTVSNERPMAADGMSSTPVQTQAPSNPFGMAQMSAATTNTTAPTQAPGSTSTAAPAPTPAQPSTNTSQTPHPLTSNLPRPLHYTQTLPLVPPQTNMSKRLVSYRGQPVRYLGDDDSAAAAQVPCYNRPDGKGPEKIWFPAGPATPDVVALNREDKIRDLQEDSAEYTDAVRRDYAYLFDEGRFKDGIIPLIAPLREWCLYDF